MKDKTFTVRIYYETYRRLRKLFKAHYKETTASYFERLAKYIENEGYR